MNNSPGKNAGLALICYSLCLLTFTHVASPAGGNVHHLIRITKTIVYYTCHCCFLAAVWVDRILGIDKEIGNGTFCFHAGFCHDLVRACCGNDSGGKQRNCDAYLFQHYKDATDQTIDSIRPVLRYSFAINNAFDYIYTGAFCTAILCWSVTILKTKKLPL